MKRVIQFTIEILAWLAVSTPVAAEPHACDLAVAHPSDPEKVTPGVSSSEVVTHVAIPACREAIAAHPDEARFHYQLARALVYWAGANDEPLDEGMAHLETAADMGHTQAIFVLGLMRKRLGEVCSVEPLYRRAAEQGLKSARISYVNEYLSGAWNDCAVGADADVMAAYLDAATGQVTGYYENMLLTALKRELSAVAEAD